MTRFSVFPIIAHCHLLLKCLKVNQHSENIDVKSVCDKMFSKHIQNVLK